MIKRLIICCFLFLAGCASAPVTMAPTPKIPGVPGTYHRVEKGQTLWRISKIYDIDLDDLARANQISDTTDIEVNQQIFIPYKQKKESCILVGNEEDFAWPIKGPVIGSFGQIYRNLINKGINIRATPGQAVIASRSGKVVFYSPDFDGYGKTIIIDHGDGFSTVYAKNSQVLIKPGDTVLKGSTIATFDATGNNYLHFEIRKGYAAQNPHFYLSK